MFSSFLSHIASKAPIHFRQELGQLLSLPRLPLGVPGPLEAAGDPSGWDPLARARLLSLVHQGSGSGGGQGGGALRGTELDPGGQGLSRSHLGWAHPGVHPFIMISVIGKSILCVLLGITTIILA